MKDCVWYDNYHNSQKVFHTSFCFTFGTERGHLMLSTKGLVQEFLFDCQVRNLAPRTIHNYEKQLNYFTRYLKEAQGVEAGETRRKWGREEGQSERRRVARGEEVEARWARRRRRREASSGVSGRMG